MSEHTSKKISELTELSDVSDADAIPVVDDSASETKKITANNLVREYSKLSTVLISADETVQNSFHNTFRVINSGAPDVTITVPSGLDSGIEVYYFRLSGGNKVTFDTSALALTVGDSEGKEIQEDKAVSLRVDTVDSSETAFLIGALEDTST